MASGGVQARMPWGDHNISTGFDSSPMDAKHLDIVWLDVLLVTIWSVVMVTGIAGNAVLTLAMMASRSLHTKSNTLIVQIIVADAVICCLLPLQSTALLLHHYDTEVELPSQFCTGVAAVATTCLWTRVVTLAIISHQRLVQHLNLKTCASIYKQKILKVMAILMWVLPMIAVLVPSVVTVCVELGYSDEKHLCIYENCSDSAIVFRVVIIFLWVIAVLFAGRNYFVIYRFEEVRHIEKKTVRRRKRRPNPRKDPCAFTTPTSPFEEVQQDSPALSHLRRKNGRKLRKKERDNYKVESKSDDLVHSSKARKGMWKSSKTKRQEREKDGIENAVEKKKMISAIDKEVKMLFSRREGLNSENDANIFPTPVLKEENGATTPGEEYKDNREVDAMTDRRLRVTNEKKRKIEGKFLEGIHQKKQNKNAKERTKKKTVCNMEIDYTDDDDDDDDYKNEKLDEPDDDNKKKENSEDNLSPTSIIDIRPFPSDKNGKNAKNAPSVTLQPVSSSKLSKRGKRRSSRQGVESVQTQIAITEAISIVSILYFMLILPKLVCFLIPTCHPIVYKVVETLYYIISCIDPFVLALRHGTFRLVLGHILERRWEAIPQPTAWVSALSKTSNDKEDKA